MDPSPNRQVANAIAAQFLLGHDAQDLWIVRETHGRCAGIFVDRDAALRFIRSESNGLEAEVTRRDDLRLFDERATPDQQRLRR